MTFQTWINSFLSKQSNSSESITEKWKHTWLVSKVHQPFPCTWPCKNVSPLGTEASTSKKIKYIEAAHDLVSSEKDPEASDLLHVSQCLPMNLWCKSELSGLGVNPIVSWTAHVCSSWCRNARKFTIKSATWFWRLRYRSEGKCFMRAREGKYIRHLSPTL